MAVTEDETWAIIASERRDLADAMARFTPEQWATPSLCEGWTVRVVAGHLTMPFEMSLPKAMIGVIRHGGNFDKFADVTSRRLAEQTTDALVHQIRDNADNHFKPPGGGAGAPLTDAVVHGLDMKVPLGLPTERPADHVNAVLDYLMTRAATRGFVKKGRVDGLHFVTTDTGWAYGEGPEVSGPGWALALALTGRPAGLEPLIGDGVAAFRRRVTA
ncbi:MAG: maleylpyruvate isomerase family mycothiol-dependent enzyme [Acidimicrobiia bacterium]